MSEQVLDVQSVLSMLRRRRRLLAALTLLGALAGATTVVLRPPLYQSTSQVLLPDPPPSAGQAASRDTATDIHVARSSVVLGPAGESLSPSLTATQLRKQVTFTSVSNTLMQIQTKSSSAKSAELMANAIARQEVTYQAQAASSVSASERDALEARGTALDNQLTTVSQEIVATKGRVKTELTGTKTWHDDVTALAQLTAQRGDLILHIDALKDKTADNQVGGDAQVVDAASPAKRGSFWIRGVVSVILGALLAFALAALVIIAMSRRDRRLRTRDEIADALGSAVIGSIRTRPQRAAAGWASLMETYQPSVMDAWSLRQALDHVGLGDLTVHRRQAGTIPARSRVLTLITLSDDNRGLAVGPELASHAAALGLVTRLVADQGHESSATLWAACSALRRDEEIRPGLHVDTRRRKGVDDLTVRMVVVDRYSPQFVGLDSNAVTVLAVSASSATAEDLARTAVAAYEAGGRISGVIVADPDSLDRTTGRLLLQQRTEQVPLPRRMTGLAADESERRSGR